MPRAAAPGRSLVSCLASPRGTPAHHTPLTTSPSRGRQELIEQQVCAQTSSNQTASADLLTTVQAAVSNTENSDDLRKQSLNVGLSGRREDTHHSALLYVFLFGCLCVILQALLQVLARPT